MLMYVHTWSTHLYSILLRNHTWELDWYAAAAAAGDDDDEDDDDDNDNRQQQTLNLYIYLASQKGLCHTLYYE